MTNPPLILRTAIAKRISQVAKTKTKFSEVARDDLNDVQQRFLARKKNLT